MHTIFAKQRHAHQHKTVLFGLLLLIHTPTTLHILSQPFIRLSKAFSHTIIATLNPTVNMCRSETSLYTKCGHSARKETHCQAYVQTQGRRCDGPSSDTGFENRLARYCPNCWKYRKTLQLQEAAIVVPDGIGSKSLPEDPNCGNPKSCEKDKAGCEAM